MPDLPPWLAKVYSLMDSLGVNLNPGILWDATRLSFVVDWFLNVGRFLDRLQVPNISPSVSVIACYHTVKYEYETRGQFGYVSTGMMFEIPTTRVQVYDRAVGVPDIPALRLNMNVDWFKVHIGAALLNQARH